MAKQVIHIFGASGAGTTTLGAYLSDMLGYYHMDTDSYFWVPTDPPYTTKRPAAERLARIQHDIDTHENVILSGSLAGWGDPLIPQFTGAVRLHTDTAIRIQRLRERERRHFGARIDTGGDMYETHMAFLQWAASYDEGDVHMRSRKHHDVWQTQLQCPLVELDGNRPLQENGERVAAVLDLCEK